MPQALVSRALAVFGACVVVVALAPPAVADPMDPIPGNGVFIVGPDIVPGLYRTAGSASTFGVWINNVPTQASMCSVSYTHLDSVGHDGSHAAAYLGFEGRGGPHGPGG